MDQAPPTRASLRSALHERWKKTNPRVRPMDHRGSRVRRQRRPSLSALLDVAPDELLGVLLQHRVDLVEQVVDVLADLLVPLGDLRVGLGGRPGLDLLVAAGLARLRLAA